MHPLLVRSILLCQHYQLRKFQVRFTCMLLLERWYIRTMSEISNLIEIDRLCYKNDIDMILIFIANKFGIKIKLTWVIRMRNFLKI